MPGFDGTGPLGQGPMTGQGRGFCILRSSENSTGQLQGFAGLQGAPVSQTDDNSKKSGKEVTNMPFGDRTGPMGLGPTTGRAAGFCAGFPVPGYINPMIGKAGYYGHGLPIFGPYNAGFYGYCVSHPAPYAGWVSPWLQRGFVFGRGFGRGRGWGRGRFGYR